MKSNDRVLLTHPIDPEAMKLLTESVGEVVLAPDGSRETVFSLLDTGFDGVIVRFNLAVDREFLEHGKKLRAVARHSVGVDSVDLAAATERGVMVVNTPTSNTSSVAEHVLTFILMLAKRLPFADAQLRLGNYAVKNSYGPDDIEGKRLGLIGFGRIGRETAKRCAAFGMEVSAFDPYSGDAVFESAGVSRCDSVAELLQKSDFVSIHVPLTPDTRGMIGAEELKLMKPGACIINCSRGGIVDESSLAAALKSGVIAGAALDVFEHEPTEPDNPLLSEEHFIGTPHIAGVTRGSVKRMSLEAVTQLLKALRGERPEALVNRDILKKTERP